MGLFKRKDGKPSKFAKILKGAAKVAGTAVQVVPLPGSSKVGQFVNKMANKIGSKNLLGKDSTVGDLVGKLSQGAGGAYQGFKEQVQGEPLSYDPGKAAEAGYIQNASSKWIVWVVGGAAVLFLGMKILKR